MYPKAVMSSVQQMLSLETDVEVQEVFDAIFSQYVAFSALSLLVGGRKGIRPIKTEWWGAGMVICLE